MPLYDMKCGYCEHVEVDALVLRDQEVLCPGCGAEYMDRLPAAPAIRFVGYGWTPKTYKGGAGPSEHDTLEETENGQLREKTGAGHNAP